METSVPDDARSLKHSLPEPRLAPRFHFSLSQLLALVLAIGLLLAAGRVLANLGEARWWEWIVIAVGFAVACAALLAVKLPRLSAMVCGLGLVFGLIGLITPALSTARNAARRSVCQGNLKQIVVALHCYHDDYGRFPPAIVRDHSGRPLHSWRVLLLPYLEQQALYARYRFDEPWDGPTNRSLHGVAMRCYACPHQPGRGPNSITDTNYAVIVGPRTAFPDDRCASLRDITDDQGNTLLVVEIAGSGIHWMEPRDLHETQMARQINPQRGQGISSLHGPLPAGGANVVMADGTVKFLEAQSMTADKIEALLTIATP